VTFSLIVRDWDEYWYYHLRQETKTRGWQRRV